MAGPSKNSRASRSASTPQRGGNASFALLVPVGGGTGAYVFNPATGTNPRLQVTSPQFTDAIRELAEAGQGAKVAAELEQFHTARPDHGWDATLQNLRTAGAL